MVDVSLSVVAAVLRRWWPVLVYMAAIFIESSIQHPPSPPGPLTDKHVHALMYAGLCALIIRALAGSWRRPVTLGAALLAFVLATAYGASDELHQHFVPTRSMDAADLAADAVGAAAAAAALVIAGRRQRTRRV